MDFGAFGEVTVGGACFLGGLGVLFEGLFFLLLDTVVHSICSSASWYEVVGSCDEAKPLLVMGLCGLDAFCGLGN